MKSVITLLSLTRARVLFWVTIIFYTNSLGRFNEQVPSTVIKKTKQQIEQSMIGIFWIPF